ncbi:MAG TPA: glycosyltransferase [Allosphingosinicella sp.]|jgi:hypothetical protein
MSVPSVSIAMSTFNGERFLEAQLDSLAAQTRPPIELQIGDDISTDATPQIVHDFTRRAPFPVIFHRNETQLGFGENFVRTARRCRGDWIAFCDQDDVWLPRKLDICTAAIAAGGADDLMLVAHDATVADEQLTPLRRLYNYPPSRLAKRLELDPDWHCTGFTQLVRGTLLREVPAEPRPTVPWHPWREPHDVWTCILANATGSILLLGEPLALYRRHAATVTDPAGSPGWADRLKALFKNNGASYRARAGYLRSIAAILRSNSAGAARDLASRMNDAADRIDEFAGRNALRAEIYGTPSAARTLRSFSALFARGGYRPGSEWSFGAKGLAKDAAAALLAPVAGRP